jgi:hypothetical protein
MDTRSWYVLVTSSNGESVFAMLGPHPTRECAERKARNSRVVHYRVELVTSSAHRYARSSLAGQADHDPEQRELARHAVVRDSDHRGVTGVVSPVARPVHRDRVPWSAGLDVGTADQQDRVGTACQGHHAVVVADVRRRVAAIP